MTEERIAYLENKALWLRQQVLKMACGAGAGAFIGVAASELFVPFFRVTGEKGTPLPPLIPINAGQDIRHLAMTFAGIMVLLGVVVITRALSRRRFAMLRGHWG